MPRGSKLKRTSELVTGRKERGVGEIRGPASVERIKADMVRLEDLRRTARQ